MQKAPNPKNPIKPGHNEKTKPKDYKYRRQQRFSASKAVNVLTKL